VDGGGGAESGGEGRSCRRTTEDPAPETISQMTTVSSRVCSSHCMSSVACTRMALDGRVSWRCDRRLAAAPPPLSPAAVVHSDQPNSPSVQSACLFFFGCLPATSTQVGSSRVCSGQ
jgi:hypothetical protein